MTVTGGEISHPVSPYQIIPFESEVFGHAARIVAPDGKSVHHAYGKGCEKRLRPDCLRLNEAFETGWKAALAATGWITTKVEVTP